MNPARTKFLFLLLTSLLGIVLLAPYHDLQLSMATGDHGRDLLAGEQVLNGLRVYHDFWWVYGPLMPYYYAAFYKILGISVHTILMAKLCLQFCAGLLVFGTLTLAVSLPMACLGAVWFWLFMPDFFFTYNHIGGIVLLLAMTYATMHYVRFGRVTTLGWAVAACVVLAFVKVNFGVAALGMLVITVGTSDWLLKRRLDGPKKMFYAAALVGAPLVIGAGYWLILKGLPLYIIRQCLPYLSVDHPYNVSPMRSLNILFDELGKTMFASWPSGWITVLVLLSVLMLIGHLARTRGRAAWPFPLFAVGFLALFYIVNLHEFLPSGVFYRTFWAKPFSILLIFILCGWAMDQLPAWSRRVLLAIFVVVVGFHAWGMMNVLKRLKTPEQFLSMPRGQVYVHNPLQWVITVEKTTEFLEATLNKDDLFFALPYDPLYYFLTAKPSPTRQTIFFDHILIRPQQERDVIRELEDSSVNYVVVSSRMRSSEEGLGILGRTYCPTIGKYLEDNFEVIKRFGDWRNPPGWAWNHGTMVLRRKTVLKLLEPAIE